MRIMRIMLLAVYLAGLIGVVQPTLEHEPPSGYDLKRIGLTCAIAVLWPVTAAYGTGLTMSGRLTRYIAEEQRQQK